MNGQHVDSITPVSAREFVGPAEGQYVVSFQETVIPPSVGADTTCVDVYSFTLSEDTEGPFCFELMRDTIPVGPSAIGFVLYDLDDCDMVFAELIEAPDQSARLCGPGLEAGTYLIGVMGVEGMEGPWEYTLTVEAPGPLGITMEEDDNCGYEPEGCEDEPAPAFRIPAK
jgi:hypothetical protein